MRKILLATALLLSALVSASDDFFDKPVVDGDEAIYMQMLKDKTKPLSAREEYYSKLYFYYMERKEYATVLMLLEKRESEGPVAALLYLAKADVLLRLRRYNDMAANLEKACVAKAPVGCVEFAQYMLRIEEYATIPRG